MDYTTKKQAIEWLEQFPDDIKLCVWCLHEVKTTEEGEEYCSNEMCLYEE